MSGRRPREDDEMVVTVMRASNGLKEELSVDSNQTLKDFKIVIAQSSKLGNVPVESQRLFHLGRELKTPGRTLSSLGVGKFGAMVIHLHATASYAGLKSNNQHSGSTQRRGTTKHTTASLAAAFPPAPLRSTPSTSTSSSSRSSLRSSDPEIAAAAKQLGTSVIDLADEDDEDDDCIVIEPSASLKRPRPDP